MDKTIPELHTIVPIPQNKHKPKALSLTNYKSLRKDISMPDLSATKDQIFQKAENLIKESKIKKDYWKADLTFKPKINNRSRKLIVTGTISDALYQDAIRRKHKSVEMAKRKPETNLKFLSEKSARLLALKLIKEFEDRANEYFGNREHTFTFPEMCEFLKMLHFTKASENGDTPYAAHEKSLQNDLWLVLKGEKFKGANERNLLVFLLAIMGLNFLIPAYVKVNSNDKEQLFERNKLPEIKIDEDNSTSTEYITSKFNDVRIQVEDVREYERNIGMRSKSFGNLDGPFAKVDSNIDKKNQNILDCLSPQNPTFLTNNTFSNIKEENLYTINTLNSSNNHDNKRKFSSFYDEYSKFIRENNKFGVFDEKENITLSSEEVQKIAKAYDIFYFNRLHAVQNTKASNDDLNNSFQPDILSVSRNLATGYREKQLEQAAKYFEETRTPIPSNGKLTHADLLFYQRLAQQNKIKRVKTAKEKELETCTFKPKVNNSYLRTSNSMYRGGVKAENVSNNGKTNSKPQDSKIEEKFGRKSISTNLGKKRTDELYSLAKLATKADKTSNEYDFEKNGTQCTFVPELVSSKAIKPLLNVTAKQSGPSNAEKCKNFEKSVDRLKKGREVREFMSFYNERCFPFSDADKNPMKFCIEKPTKSIGFEAFAKENINTLNSSYSTIKSNKTEKHGNENGYISVYNRDNSVLTTGKSEKEDNTLLLWSSGNSNGNNSNRPKNQNLPLSGISFTYFGIK